MENFKIPVKTTDERIEEIDALVEGFDPEHKKIYDDVFGEKTTDERIEEIDALAESFDPKHKEIYDRVFRDGENNEGNLG